MAQTKWQREAKKMIDEAEGDGGSTIKAQNKKIARKKTWRSRAYRRVASKHPVLAPLAWLGVGLLTLVGKGTRGTVVGGFRGSRSASRVVRSRLVTRIQADVHRRKWTTEADLVDGKRPREHYRCCDRSFTSIQELNWHAVNAHQQEKRTTIATPATIQAAATAKHAGKTLVLDAPRGGGRHRAGHKLPGARSVQDLVNHYQAHLTKIGANIMAVNSATEQLKRAAAGFGDTRKPKDLGELRAICVGMEKAMVELSESIGAFGIMLKQSQTNGGLNIAPELVNPFMARAQMFADSTGKQFTAFIAAFEVFYGLAIRMAAAGTPIPNLNLRKTG